MDEEMVEERCAGKSAPQILLPFLVMQVYEGTPLRIGRQQRGFMQKRPMGLEIEAPTPDKYEKGAGRLEGGTA